MKRSNYNLLAGTFNGAELEPGTFHFEDVPGTVHPVHGIAMACGVNASDDVRVEDENVDNSDGPAESDA